MKIADYGYGDDDNQGLYEYDQYYTDGDADAQRHGLEYGYGGEAVDIMQVSGLRVMDSVKRSLSESMQLGMMIFFVFHWMMSCTVVYAVLNVENMLCRQGYFQITKTQYYDWKGIQTDYRSDGLYTIDEDDKSRHHEKDPGAGWVSGSADEEQFVK